MITYKFIDIAYIFLCMSALENEEAQVFDLKLYTLSCALIKPFETKPDNNIKLHIFMVQLFPPSFLSFICRSLLCQVSVIKC